MSTTESESFREIPSAQEKAPTFDRGNSHDLPPVSQERPVAPAKLRILATANQLFYGDGIRSVGIDRLIGESTVTKATFYKHYGSKDRLILEYIAQRHAAAVQAMGTLIAESSSPEYALRRLIEQIATEVLAPGFRGCPFINAAVEFPDPHHALRRVVSEHRGWYTATISKLMLQIGHSLPGEAADDFVLARDGAMSGGYASDPVAASTAFVRIASRLLEADHGLTARG